MGRASISPRATRSASGLLSVSLPRPERNETLFVEGRPVDSNERAIFARNCLRQRRYSAGLMRCRLQMAVSGLPWSPSSTTLALDAGSHCRAGTSFRPPSVRKLVNLFFFGPASINQHREDVNQI